MVLGQKKKNSEDGRAVVSHRARLPLAFFHEIPTPLSSLVRATRTTPANQPEEIRSSANDARFPVSGAQGDDLAGASAVGLCRDDGGTLTGVNPNQDGAAIGSGRGGISEGGLQRPGGGGEVGGTGIGEGSYGLGCGTYVWRRCLVKQRDPSSDAVVVEWDETGEEVSPVFARKN